MARFKPPAGIPILAMIMVIAGVGAVAATVAEPSLAKWAAIGAGIVTAIGGFIWAATKR